jgi:Fe-S cluster assembly protein SufD
MSALERMLAALAAPATAGSARSAAAAARLRALGLPARGHEDWRYANLAALESVASFTAAGTSPGDAAWPAAAAAWPEPLPGHARLAIVDGQLAPGGALPAGVRAVPAAASAAAAASDEPAAGLLRFGLLAEALAPAPLAFEMSGAGALELLVLGSSGDAARYARLELRLAPGAQWQLAERHLGDTGGHGLACQSLQLSLGQGARLCHQRLLALGGTGLQLDTVAAELGADAHYQQRCMIAGAGTVRSSQSLRLAGRGAQLDWQGLAVGAGREVRDISLALRHEAPDTVSSQLFRGIADGRARVACTADAHVAASAPGTRLAQSLRGLIDGEGAEIDLRPRLTILTDAVQASHGATTGRLDPDLLFYLLARGLEPAEARALLKWAFLGEVFAGCEPPALRSAAERAIAAQLRERPPAELLQ